ncbi:MAG: hypothetical protein ACXADC_12095 [Candidatus Thorarchaeota archaeon]|jgi:hypothetical protein
MPKRITKSDLLEVLREERIRKRLIPLLPIGANLHYFYALAKQSGVLHYVMAGDDEFDEDDYLISFFAFCGRRIKKKDSPYWSKKWSFFMRSEKHDIEYMKECSTCLKSYLFKALSRHY